MPPAVIINVNMLAAVTVSMFQHQDACVCSYISRPLTGGETEQFLSVCDVVAAQNVFPEMTRDRELSSTSDGGQVEVFLASFGGQTLGSKAAMDQD